MSLYGNSSAETKEMLFHRATVHSVVIYLTKLLVRVRVLSELEREAFHKKLMFNLRGGRYDE